MVEQSAIYVHCVTFERPRRIRIANGQSQVRHVAEHDAFVRQRLRELDGLPIDPYIEAAKELQIKTRGRHDEVGFKLPYPNAGGYPAR